MAGAALFGHFAAPALIEIVHAEIEDGGTGRVTHGQTAALIVGQTFVLVIAARQHEAQGDQRDGGKAAFAADRDH